MKYNTELGSRVFGLTFIVALFSLFFNSCSNSTEGKEDENIKRDTIIKSNFKNQPGISFENQLELEKKYRDSIPIKDAEDFFDLDLTINNKNGKVSYSFLDLDFDGLPDKIISIKGDFDLGRSVDHIILLNRKDFYLNIGFVSQMQHDGPIDFNPIHVDDNNGNYFLLNSQGWGSGFNAELNEIFRIENGTVKELFFYPVYSSYLLDFGDYYPDEIIESKHKFINDTLLILDMKIYYLLEVNGKNIRSNTFKERVTMKKVEDKGSWNSFVVIESTNPTFLEMEDFLPMSFYYLYGGKIANPHFQKAWDNYQELYN